MTQGRVVLGAVALVLAAVSASAQGLTADDEGQAAQFLVGKWTCTHTAGDFSGAYTMVYTSVFGGRWLKQTFEFPATGEGPAVETEYFLSYDARIPQWVRFGAHSNGQYYGTVGKRAGNVWSWTYVLPGRGASAVWTKKSAVEYAVDGPSYPQGGKVITEHHSCRKVP
ncbi:MAG TPA: hypothetical protein VM736_05250 [Gemmatimonadales bacterium]|nr:hypothetical protein [Gemmatimonadales bacterium]